MPLPQNGQQNWGTPLNADIQNDEANIANLQTSTSQHANNIPNDPHGDRAFTTGLVSPITTGLNQAPVQGLSLGLVQLTPQGKIPLNLVPTGAGLTNYIDAIPDFNVPTNGAPASTALNAALQAANAGGGGIVWVGSGQFGIDQPLVIYQNTWLMCSPGAVFTRILTTTAPTALLQNYSFNVVPVGGNIRVSGGLWNVANLAQTGVAFSFVATSSVLLQDLAVVANNNGNSPAGELFGCNNVTIDNVSVTAAAPAVTGRTNQALPLWRIEECNSGNKPGLPSSVYAGQECTNIILRGCNLTPSNPWPADTYGTYSAFTSFLGTKGSVVNGARHININVIGGCYATALATAGIEVKNWSNTTVTDCDFNQPQNPYVTVMDGVSGVIPPFFLYWVNSPTAYPLFQLVTVTNTSTETTCARFQIPVNDWVPGTSAYRHRHSGYVTTGTSAGQTVTFRIYLGINGTNADHLIQTITATVAANQTQIPYAINHRGFDIDVNGVWTDVGVEALGSSTVFSGFGWNNGVLIQPPNSRVPLLVNRGSIIYITITAQWSITSTTYILVPTAGTVERIYQ